MTAKNTNGGDVRVAIKSLLYCATHEAPTVVECFAKAREDVTKDVLAGVNDKGLLILKAAMEEPTKLMKAVYQRYVMLCRGYKDEAYGYTQFSSTAAYLASLGLAALMSTKINRTFANRMELLISPEELNAVFEQRFQ